jgi:ankyrin repeat protein
LALLFINQTDSEALSDLIVNDLTDGTYLPLHLACRHKNEKLEIVKTYLYKIFDNKKFQQCIYKEDKHKQTILHISIENNHINIVELLFRNFAINTDLRESQDGNLPIHSAAKNGSLEMFSLLQKYDAVSFETNKNMENALHIASSHNRSKFISEFLKYEKAYINSDDNERFVKCACACRSGETHVSCKKGIDNRNFTPLLTALATCNQRCVEELIDDEKESNTLDLNGNTMYHVCAKYDNFESLKYLFLKTNEKNDVSLFAVKNSLDETILHLSSRNGNLEMTNFIFNKMHESNSNLDELVYNKNNNGQTCFHIAAGKGFFNLIEYFLKVISLLYYLIIYLSLKFLFLEKKTVSIFTSC